MTPPGLLLAQLLQAQAHSFTILSVAACWHCGLLFHNRALAITVTASCVLTQPCGKTCTLPQWVSVSMVGGIPKEAVQTDYVQQEAVAVEADRQRNRADTPSVLE